MRIVEQKYEIISPNGILGLQQECHRIERMARLCYKSEDKIAPSSWKKMITVLREKQHGAMLEHSSMTVLFTTDRGVTHELVRHRVASFAQESTRYCNYTNDKFSNEITVVSPFLHEHGTDCDSDDYDSWKSACEKAEQEYFNLIKNGETPQIARSVLPTCLKAEIGVTANFREWLHIFKMRCAKDAHPQIRALMTPLYEYLHETIPEVFTL
jgi:thymidylate synthase (FAD)